jgi:ATP-binding cassette, subfamily G (WHITE), member 2, PDR
MAENNEKWWPSSSTPSELPHEPDAQVGALARTMTGLSQSTHGSKKELDDDIDNPFLGVDDPRLDPLSGNFDSVMWTKTILQLQSRDPDGYPHHTAAVSFSNLNVYGYGKPTDYQKTVGNYLLAIPGLVRDLSSGRGRRVDILKNFEGYTCPLLRLV